jgi:hypothetical protein
VSKESAFPHKIHHRKADGVGWVTMADPQGNLFCVERSATERG